MSLSSITSGQYKAIKSFIAEIPAEKLIPTGFAGTLYPPDKDKEEGGWRLDEQGYTTAKLAYNLQIQLNTTGGKRGPSVILVLVSVHGLKNGKIDDNVIRKALETALDADPRKIYITYDGTLIDDHAAFQKGEQSLKSPDDAKGKGKKK